MKTVQLGSVCDFLNGGTPSRKVERYFQGEIPWITSSDIVEDEVTDIRYFITDEAIENSATRIVPKDNILLVSRTGVGKVAITTEDICISQDFTGIMPDRSQVDLRYLFRFLQAKRPYFVSHQRGATIQGITRRVISDLALPLPPLEEQQRIAAILDKADALRAQRRAALAKLDTLLQATFLDMFGDPVTNPMGWTTCKIGDVANLKGGYAFKSNDYVDKGIPLIRIGEVNRKDFDSENLVCLPSSFREHLERFVVRNGTILMSLTGTTGKDDYGNAVLLNGNREEFFLNQRVAAIIPSSSELRNLYLCYFLKDQGIKRKLTGMSRGVRQANISNSDVTRLQIPMPPVSTQKEFERVVKKTTEQLNKNRCMEVELDNLFYSLQQRAFKGELYPAQSLS